MEHHEHVQIIEALFDDIDHSNLGKTVKLFLTNFLLPVYKAHFESANKEKKEAPKNAK